MDQIRHLRNVAVLITALSFVSCSQNYQLVKANRAEYPINASVSPDSSVIKAYLPYKQQLDAEMNQVIGHSEVQMPKVDTIPESLLGNFFADATLQQARKYDATIDFAMPSTKGGIRVALPKGKVTLSNLFELMPFENELIAFTLSGADTQNLINFIAATNGQPVSGLQMKIKNRKPESVMINGQPFDAAKTYRVLTSDYIASGGDNARGFKNPIAKKVLGLKVRDALIGYVKETEAAGKTINAKLDGRIVKD